VAARSRSRPEARRIALDEDLRIAGARAAFDALAAGKGDVEIDASRVARVDAAGLQALVAGIARVRAGGASCRWHEPSGALAAAASLAGLARALELEG
jgi:anti-anti-sigma regulatory factor